MMTVRSRGSRKYSAASAVIRDVAMNRCFRQRLMPGILPWTSSIRDTKYDALSGVERAFAVGAADQRYEAGDVRLVHVAEAGGDVDDLVVLVPEVVDLQPLPSGDVGRGHRLDRENEDVLVEDLVVFDVCPQRQRGGGLAAVEEDGGAWYPVQRGFHGVQLVDERSERPFLAVPLKRDEFAASLPGGSTSKSEYPALQEAVQPHIDSFNAITSQNLLEIAIRDIGKKTIFDHKGDENGGRGNKLTFWLEDVQLSRPALTSRERTSLNRRLYPAEVHSPAG